MIPKSLHTVTALVNVARVIRAPGENTKSAAIRAAIVLGYAHHSDDYYLLDKAGAILARESVQS